MLRIKKLMEPESAKSARDKTSVDFFTIITSEFHGRPPVMKNLASD